MAAMNSVHAFLHGELPEETADEIRQHLMACESCMDNFDAESLIDALLKRCGAANTVAPASLRVSVQSMTIIKRL